MRRRAGVTSGTAPDSAVGGEPRPIGAVPAGAGPMGPVAGASVAGRSVPAGPAAERPSRFYRFLFSFMGPPQLGSLDAPTRPTRPRVDICRRCGQPQDVHELERLADRTASRCPTGH